MPRKTEGALQNRLVVNLGFPRLHLWALWYLRSTAFPPGVIAVGSANRAIEVAFAVSRWGPTKKPCAEHTAELPPRSVDARRRRFDDTNQRRKARPFTSFNSCSKRSSNHCAGGPAVRPSHDAINHCAKTGPGTLTSFSPKQPSGTKDRSQVPRGSCSHALDGTNDAARAGHACTQALTLQQ